MLFSILEWCNPPSLNGAKPQKSKCFQWVQPFLFLRKIFEIKSPFCKLKMLGELTSPAPSAAYMPRDGLLSRAVAWFGNPAPDSLPEHPSGTLAGIVRSYDNPLSVREDKGQLAPGILCNLDEIGGRPTTKPKFIAHGLNTTNIKHPGKAPLLFPCHIQ